jgi:hypothetical protein
MESTEKLDEVEVTQEMIDAAFHAFYEIDPRWHSSDEVFENVCVAVLRFVAQRIVPARTPT